ncbi:hypothetical protein ACEPAI_8565 [Sanghuangporus weigelae]
MSVVRFMDSVADEFPDDNSSKNVYVQAEGRTYSGLGDRHVLLWWANGTYEQGQWKNLPTTQILQLTGQSGYYNYYHPVVKKRRIASMEMNQQFLLGTFTRAQRDKIIELVNSVKFSKTSTVNGCRVWMRDLLDAMVTAGLITASTFNTVVVGVPLPQRVAEALA